MSLPTTLVLNDGTRDLTFNLVDNIHGKGFYQHRIDGRPDLAYQLSITNPKTNTGRKCTMELNIPIVRTVNGESTRVDMIRNKVTFPVPDVATVADRSVDAALIRAIMSSSLLDVVKNSVGA